MVRTRSNHTIVLIGISIILMSPIYVVFLIYLPISRQGRHDFLLRSPGECDDIFRFVPGRNQSLKNCEDLFVGTSAAGFEMSKDYMTMIDAFRRETERVWDARPEVLEDYSYQLPTMFKAMHYIASRPHIKHVCETGFNMGHSSFNFLTASKKTTVHSFDYGSHGYAHSMADYMDRTFSGRIFVRFGDSTKTIPEFIRSNPHFRCDLIYIDGGHTYEVALADMLNLASLASDVTGGAVILFDDYPSLMFDMSFGAAWEDMRRWGYIDEKMRCSFKSKDYRRGFVVGRVTVKPKL